MLHVAEPEELEAGGGQDRDVEHEHEARGDPADHVRDQLAEDDAPGGLAGDLRCEHEVAVPQQQRLASEDARLERPEGQREDQDHRQGAAASQVGRDDDQERDRRDDEEDVREEVDDLVDQSARVGGEDAEHRRERRREERCGGAENERTACTEHDLGEDVAALVGGAEEVVPRRRLPRREQVEVGRVGDRDPRCDQRDDDHEADEHEPEERLRVPREQGQPAGQPQPAAAPRRHDGERECLGLDDRRLQLRHQEARTRGSRTKLRRSMTKLDAITQRAKTSSRPWVSG